MNIDLKTEILTVLRESGFPLEPDELYLKLYQRIYREKDGYEVMTIDPEAIKRAFDELVCSGSIEFNEKSPDVFTASLRRKTVLPG